MIVLFSYELKPALLRNVAPLIREIQSYPGWCQCFERTWLIATTEDDINALNQRLARHLRKTDYWLLIRIRPEYQGWLPNEIWEWIEDASNRIGI